MVSPTIDFTTKIDSANGGVMAPNSDSLRKRMPNQMRSTFRAFNSGKRTGKVTSNMLTVGMNMPRIMNRTATPAKNT